VHKFDGCDFLPELTPGYMGEERAQRTTSPKCGGERKVIAVIQEPEEINRMLLQLIKIGFYLDASDHFSYHSAFGGSIS
jgi:hypothetical protein